MVSASFGYNVKISLQFTVMNFAYAKRYDMSDILYQIQLQTVNLCAGTIITVNVRQHS